MDMAKISGVVFGTAIGDALGAPIEFRDVRPSHPEVTIESRPNRYTDDTQMFRAVVEGLLAAPRDGGLEIAAVPVAKELVAWLRSPENNRAPGNACLSGCRRLSMGVSWRQCGAPGAGGCGAAMRSMAYSLFLDPEEAAQWAAEHALMTHGHPMGQASAAATAAAVCLAAQGLSPREVVTGAALEAEKWDQATSDMVMESLALLHAPAERVLDDWRGWAGHEAIAASLWCFLQAPDNFARAVLLAVNSPGDSDSLGAITGALVGARVGVFGIPSGWLGGVEDQDGLIELARRIQAAVKEG